MGASRGSHFTEHDLAVLRQQAGERLEQSRNDAEVNSFLQQELAEINSRDVDGINRRLEEIEDALAGGVELDRLRFGGSVAKHTYVDGLSDVDALVVLSDESLGDASPEDVIGDFRDSLARSLRQGPIDDIRAGTMAVTIEYRDGTVIQLLPAVQVAGELSISSADGAEWSPIEPRRFAQRLTAVNERQGAAVVPAIKLAKAIFAGKLGDEAPTGYHVEALAVAAFSNYSGARTPRAMLTHLIESASGDVLRPVRDVTGQSTYVDAYLGDSESSERRSLSRSLVSLVREMSSQSISEWRRMFE